MLTVHWAGRGQLRRSVDWPRVGHILGESTAADVAVIMASYIVVAIGRVLQRRQNNKSKVSQ